MREIELLTLWDLNDLMAYWHDHPPTHVLVAAYLLGGKQPNSRQRRSHSPGRQARTSTASNFDELAREVIFAGGSISSKLPSVYRSS